LPYDGVDDALFRADATTLYSYELLLDFHDMKFGKATSFKSCWEFVRSRYFRAGYVGGAARTAAYVFCSYDSVDVPPRADLTFAYLCFVALMRLDYDRSFAMLGCAACLQQYNKDKTVWVVLDGISAGIRQSAVRSDPLAVEGEQVQAALFVRVAAFFFSHVMHIALPKRTIGCTCRVYRKFALWCASWHRQPA
jgi:hypothetical protein